MFHLVLARDTNNAGNGATAAIRPNGAGVPLSIPSGFTKSLDHFSSSLGNLSHVMNGFSGSANMLARALEAMPHTIQITGSQRLEVVHVGSEAFANLEPLIKWNVDSKISETLRRVLNRHFSSAGPFHV